MRQQSLILTKILDKNNGNVKYRSCWIERAENQQRVGCDYGRILGWRCDKNNFGVRHMKLRANVGTDRRNRGQIKLKIRFRPHFLHWQALVPYVWQGCPFSKIFACLIKINLKLFTIFSWRQRTLKWLLRDRLQGKDPKASCLLPVLE